MTRSSGFTLIELLVVVAILGILSAVGTLAYNGYVGGAKKSSAENYLQQIALAQTEEYSSTGEYFISSTGTASACSVNADSSSEIETNLFSGENVLADDIGFQFCIFGSGATFTAVAENTDGCVISLNRNGAPSRAGC